MLQAGRLQVCFPLGSLGFFIDLILLGHIMTQGSTHPLTEMVTRIISCGGKDSQCVGLKALSPCADCLEILGSRPSATLRASPGLYKDCITCVSMYIQQNTSDTYHNYQILQLNG